MRLLTWSNLNLIFHRSEELDSNPANDITDGLVERITDLTSTVETKVSSRAAMVGSLTDGSTETFWESGDEDRNKSKWVQVSLPKNSDNVFKNVAIHIDNGRDLGNKVLSVTFRVRFLCSKFLYET